MQRILVTFLLILISGSIYAQVGIGTISPNSSSALDITSASKGLLTPRMSSAQRTAISSPATGLLVYQTDGVSGFYYYSGSAWLNLSTQTLTLPLSVANGGTGAASLTSGNVLFGNGTTALTTSNNLHWDNTNNRLGIGTASPSFPLQISSTVSFNLTGGYGFLVDGGLFTTTGDGNNTGNVPFSLYASGRIAAAEFDAYSDERIKENIRALPAGSSSAMIDRLRPVTFQYIDKPVKGDRVKYGLIAQELEKVFPSAVNRSSEFIPNIFREVHQGNTTIACNLPGIKEGDEVRLITTKGEKIVRVRSVEKGALDLAEDQQPSAGGPHLATESDASTFLTLDWPHPDQDFFVYGTRVNDLRTVDYDQLIVLCIAAVQELDRKVMTQQESLADQFRKMSRKERRQLRKMLK